MLSIMPGMTHKWTAITVNGEPWEVSADAPKLDGVRVTVTYHEALNWAEQFDAQLPTAEILDARFEQADLKNLPHTQRLWEGQDDAALHSRLIDQDIAEHVAQHGQPRIVGNAGKHWVEATTGGFPLYGWHIDDDLPTWRGIKLHPAASRSTSAQVIQPYSSRAHPGGHHKDYSSTLILCRPLRSGTSAPPDTDPDPESDAIVTPPRITSLDERGASVRAWQEFVGALVDSWHGPITEALTVAWLAEHSEVDRNSTLPPGTPDTIPGPPPTALTEPIDDFIQAKNYTVRCRELNSIRVIVVHSTENDIAPGVARNVACWFGGPQAPKASAHYVVGPDETVGCVKLRHAAWAAPGANTDGVQVELVGRAFKTDWLKDGRAVLENGAELVAWLCRHLDLPMRRVTVDGLLRGERGITTHASVTEAYHRSTHVDPGGQGDKRWPWREFLGMVEAAGRDGA